VVAGAAGLSTTIASADTTLRYLGPREVGAHLPTVSRWVPLARTAFEALADGTAEMPPKLSLRPGPGVMFDAMPGWHGPTRIVGLKWIADVAENRGRGLPSVHGLIVLNDPDTGVAEWIIDAAAITAARTAGVSGLAVDLYASPAAKTVAILGSGVQARSHVQMLGHLRPGAHLIVFTPDPASAERFTAWAREQPGIAEVVAAGTAREAVAGAEIVISAAAINPGAQPMQKDWIRADGLVIAIDDDTYVSAALANAAAALVVDDRSQFNAFRAQGAFVGYPDPTVSLTEAVLGTASDQLAGASVVATLLGCAEVDLVFADAVRGAAHAAGTGTELPR
jgi:alanine dehydrogenase